MKKNVFAVCDLEVDYALNFMEYLNQKRNIPFEIQAFTTVDSLTAYGEKVHIELLLISGKAMCQRVRELDIGKIIILSEGVHPPELDQYPSVYKYQSSANVIREVMACYGEEKAVEPTVYPVLKKCTQVLGILSTGSLPENILCTYTWAGAGQRKGGSLPEPGGVFRFWKVNGKGV